MRPTPLSRRCAPSASWLCFWLLGSVGCHASGIGRAAFPDAVGVGPANDAAGGHVEAIAELIFTRYVFPFEVVSALLITAAVGAMVLTHRERLTPRKTQANFPPSES